MVWDVSSPRLRRRPACTRHPNVDPLPQHLRDGGPAVYFRSGSGTTGHRAGDRCSGRSGMHGRDGVASGGSVVLRLFSVRRGGHNVQIWGKCNRGSMGGIRERTVEATPSVSGSEHKESISRRAGHPVNTTTSNNNVANHAGNLEKDHGMLEAQSHLYSFGMTSTLSM